MDHQEAIAKFLTTHFGDRFAATDMAKPISALGVDSLDLLEFVMAVEEEFDVEIEADQVDLDKGLDQFTGIIGQLSQAESLG